MRASVLACQGAEISSIALPTVTLIAATSMAVKQTAAAMRQSCRGLRFGHAVLFTHDDPMLDPADGIQWRRIARLQSRADYSRFMLKELAGHIETDHILCVQWDGFVIRPEAWSQAFLDYDYIGARWPQFREHTVGNGGFSLRSKRLLEMASKLEISPTEAEDLAICRRCRPVLEKAGIRFAGPDVADVFSYERTKPSGLEFGFHGIFNLPDLTGPKDFRRYIADLEPGLIGRREWRDLWRQSLKALDVPLAIELLRYEIRSTVSD